MMGKKENVGGRNDEELEQIRKNVEERKRHRRQSHCDDDEGRWITTENGHHVHINAEGTPDKGNPHDRKNGGEAIREYYGAASEWDDDD